MSGFHVSGRQPQNVYRGDAYIGVMFSPEDAALVVEALTEVERVHGPALPVAVASCPRRRLRIYVEPRDIWIGVYLAPEAIYFCPVPMLVIKWVRAL